MSKQKQSDHIKFILGSEDAYTQLVPITDAVQTGELKPWGKSIIELLASYGINIERRKDLTVQTTLSFPTSTQNRSMAIGIRYIKVDKSFAEDLFLFEEGLGLTCYYRGTQEKDLPEYDDTHHRKIELSEFLPDVQRDIADLKRQVSDGAVTPPEINLMINAQANNNRFDVQLVNKSSQSLVAEGISINGVETPLNQQFSKLFPIPHVNMPDGIFDAEQDEVSIVVRYRTLDDRHYELIQLGEQQYRTGDGRYNVIFPAPIRIRSL